MARKTDLMGLGMPAPLARRIAVGHSAITGQGSTRASSTTINGDQYLVSITASNSGCGVLLPTIGGDVSASGGALIGDAFIVNNQVVGGCTVFAPAGCSISIAGAVSSGSGGVALSSNTTSMFWAASVTSWVGLQGS